MTMKNANSYCKGRTKSGKACRAAPTEGGLCYFHANPNKASELGRIGGLSNRHFAAENFEPLPKLETAMAIRDTVAQLIAKVYAGKLSPRIAFGLAPLLNLQFRAIEATDLKERLTNVEKLLAKAETDSLLKKD